MLFQVYGENAMYQWLGWIMVFVSLIAANEVARRSKTGGIVCFLGIPAVLTVYFISIYVCAGMGMEWALDNPTYLHMGSWFHYAKLYAATAGCIGFMMLKYGWGKLGRSEAFKVFPLPSSQSTSSSRLPLISRAPCVLSAPPGCPPRASSSWADGTMSSTASPASSTSFA